MFEHYIHATAIVEAGAAVGPRTRVWAHAHILPGAVVGADCNICDGVFVEGGARVGDRVTLKCGVQLWTGVTLEDDVFVGPNATFANDAFPRSRRRPDAYAPTVVRKGASIGANATILPGLTIGPNAMIGAGSVVTRDVPPNAIVVGNPARIKGYADTTARGPADIGSFKRADPPRGLLVPSVRLVQLPVVTDLRGALSFAQFGDHLPFVPKRYFVVFDVPSFDVRGEHAHKALHQFLICVKGSCAVMVDDGRNRDEVELASPGIGLHIPPMVWGVQYKYSPDAVLLVLASEVYDADDYVRDYDEFVQASAEHAK